MFAMRDPDNLIPHIVPSCVKAIIDMTDGDTDLDIVRAWWQYNNQTHFLRHAATARLVRAVIKLDAIKLQLSINSTAATQDAQEEPLSETD